VKLFVRKQVTGAYLLLIVIIIMETRTEVMKEAMGEVGGNNK